jgi:hypothetical protein
VTQIIHETAEALYRALKGYIKPPSTAAAWQSEMDKFEELWNHRTMGAVDGRHCRITVSP